MTTTLLQPLIETMNVGDHVFVVFEPGLSRLHVLQVLPSTTTTEDILSYGIESLNDVDIKKATKTVWGLRLDTL